MKVGMAKNVKEAMVGGFALRKLFRFRLWFLLVLFVPCAILAKNYADTPDVLYSENRSDIFRSGDVFLGFDKDPQGIPIQVDQKVDNAFTSLGLSFSFGVPTHLPDVRNETPMFATHVFNDEQVLVRQDKSHLEKKACDRSVTKVKRWVAKTSLRFLDGLPDNLKSDMICLVNSETIFRERFQGTTVIHFHEPDDPKASRGVFRFGFVAYELSVPRTLEVRCYSPKGDFLARQSNISTGTVFMGFKSKRKVGWIEIEGVGPDKAYGIGALSFEK